MKIEKEFMYKSLGFCPVRITLNKGMQFIVTRCWEYLENKGIEIPEFSESDEEIVVYDLESKIFTRFLISGIKSYGIINYKGMMYFK